jgi:hypothetical protein
MATYMAASGMMVPGRSILRPRFILRLAGLMPFVNMMKGRSLTSQRFHDLLDGYIWPVTFTKHQRVHAPLVMIAPRATGNLRFATVQFRIQMIDGMHIVRACAVQWIDNRGNVAPEASLTRGHGFRDSSPAHQIPINSLARALPSSGIMNPSALIVLISMPWGRSFFRILQMNMSRTLPSGGLLLSP